MKIVTTHKGSDFDALASLVAATILYPDAKPVLPRSINPNLKSFLAIHKDLFSLYSPKDIDYKKVKTLIVVDTHSWKCLEDMNALKERKNLEIIVWDHHTSGDIKANKSFVKRTGATVTILVEKIKKRKRPVTPIQATLLLIGLYEDTGNLSFPSTTHDDAYAAGFLLEKKADLYVLLKFLKQAYGKEQKNILFNMIQNAKRRKISEFSVSISKIDIRGYIKNLAVVIQMYREIINVDVAFGIFRDIETNKCMVIGRSSSDMVNIGLIMRSIGGGGHPGAGSALLKSGSPDAIEETITELISGNQNSSITLSDIMSYPVITVNQNTKIEKAEATLRKKGCTGMPVVDKESNTVGIISRRDFKKIGKKHAKSPVKAFMKRQIITIPYDKSAMEAVKLMIRHDIGRIPVMDHKKLIGIITRSDVMSYFYDMLPG